jgi:hypothetical protein
MHSSLLPPVLQHIFFVSLLLAAGAAFFEGPPTWDHKVEERPLLIAPLAQSFFVHGAVDGALSRHRPPPAFFAVAPTIKK